MKCECGHDIDEHNSHNGCQHVTKDFVCKCWSKPSKIAAAELARLQRIEQAASKLQSRLDDHFGGTYDWKEQAELRDALKGNK